MNKIATLFVCLGLAGCGSIYVSPSVDKAASVSGLKVQVIPITTETTMAANRSSYAPQNLPAEFFQTAGSGQPVGSASGTFSPVSRPQTLPAEAVTRIPPNPAAVPYTIGVGDGLLLATPMAGSTVEQLSGLMAAENSRQGYTVQDDGSIAVPSVGRVNLAGMTIEQAEEALFAQLLKAGMDPSISIEINKFASKHIVVGGSVGNPAVIPVGLSPLRLMETLQVAGGVKVPDPDFATVRIYRSGDLYQIPVRDIYDSAKLQNLRLIDGDTVFVDTTYDLDQARAFFQEQISSSNAQRSMRDQALSELDREISLRNSELSARRSNFDKQIEYGAVDRDYVYMSGEVKNQARVALPFNQRASLADVLYGEGGFPTREGNPSQIYVLRGSDNPSEFSGLKAYQLDTRNAVNLILATRFEMRPNDIIFIAEQPVTKWNRAISQITPGDFFGLAATVAAVQ